MQSLGARRKLGWHVAGLREELRQEGEQVPPPLIVSIRPDLAQSHKQPKKGEKEKEREREKEKEKETETETETEKKRGDLKYSSSNHAEDTTSTPRQASLSELDWRGQRKKDSANERREVGEAWGSQEGGEEGIWRGDGRGDVSWGGKDGYYSCSGTTSIVKTVTICVYSVNELPTHLLRFMSASCGHI